MEKVTPFLWFDDQAQEAMNFYVSIFKNSKILNITPGPSGMASGVTFQLNGQEFMALNGGSVYKFTEAISFFVKCETQEEIDELWDKLSKGGEKGRSGWLKDKFGISWQIIPSILGDMLSDQNPNKANNTMNAMLKMKKISIAKLIEAFNREG